MERHEMHITRLLPIVKDYNRNMIMRHGLLNLATFTLGYCLFEALQDADPGATDEEIQALGEARLHEKMESLPSFSDPGQDVQQQRRIQLHDRMTEWMLEQGEYPDDEQRQYITDAIDEALEASPPDSEIAALLDATRTIYQNSQGK